MALGDFTKEEAMDATGAVVALFNAIPQSKQRFSLSDLNRLSIFLQAAEHAAPWQAERWYFAADSKPGRDTVVEVYDVETDGRAYASLHKIAGAYVWCLAHDSRGGTWHLSAVSHWRPLQRPMT